LSARFRRYLLDKFNGDTPANYFSRFKKVIKAATKLGYFKYDPAMDLAAISNSNHMRKEHLEAEEYITLLKAPCTNEEVREAFILSCYTGMRWCDVKALNWRQVKEGRMMLVTVQRKTKVENIITLHPVAKAILDKRRGWIASDAVDECIFRLPSQEGALKCLDTWIRRAGIDKHITWNSARLSFSILLQDANVDAATVALLLGHTSTKYVLNTYKRFRPKDPRQAILKLPWISDRSLTGKDVIFSFPNFTASFSYRITFAWVAVIFSHNAMYIFTFNAIELIFSALLMQLKMKIK